MEKLWRYHELGITLRGLQRYQEAAVHLEKSFREYLPEIGVLHQGKENFQSRPVLL